MEHASIFTVDVETRDVEGVIEGLAESLQRWEKGARPALDLSAVTSDGGGSLGEQARRLKLQWNVDANAIIHSNRPGLGPAIIRFQRLVRRATWWFFEPILQPIRLFQRNAARVVDGLAQNDEVMAARVTQLEARVAELEHQLEAQLERRGIAARRDPDTPSFQGEP
jgi:hypothetical protein